MSEEQKINDSFRAVAPYLTLGAQLAITVVVFFFLGKWADGYFGTEPWLMIAAIIIGSAGGLIKFFRTVIDLGNKEEHERRTDI